MNRRLRIASLSLGGFVAAVVLAALIAMYVVLQPERFTALLQSRARAAGLELTLANPASPTLWPKPALELEGITLRGNARSAPLVIASRGKIVLPWHTLLGGDTTISRIEVDGARIDLDAVSAYLDTLPPRSSTAGAVLPAIDAGFRITHGTLARGNTLVLSDVDIDAGRLASGHHFDLSLGATASGQPYAIDLDASPSLDHGVLSVGDLTVRVSSATHFDSKLRGDATWRGGADVGASLAGSMTREGALPFDLAINVTPADEADPLYVALKVDGPTDHADVRIPPLALAAWWTGLGSGTTPSLPPLLGTVDASVIDAGSVHVKGLHIRATGDSPAPAATATMPAPASTVGARPARDADLPQP